MVMLSRPSSMPAMLRLDPLVELDHDAIGGREEQLTLAGKMTIDGPFANLEPIRQNLGDRVGEAMLAEQFGRCLQDLFTARRHRLFIATALRLLLDNLAHQPLIANGLTSQSTL